jgi:hypothetical protein
MPDKSLTTGSLICAKATRRRDQSTSSTLHKIHKFKLLQIKFSYVKVKMIQSLNSGKNKTSGRYTWEAIHKVSLINIVLPLKFSTIWNRTTTNWIT